MMMNRWDPTLAPLWLKALWIMAASVIVFALVGLIRASIIVRLPKEKRKQFMEISKTHGPQ